MGLFKRIKKRKQSQKANTNRNVPYMMEMLEPRIMLSADLSTTYVADYLSDSLDQLYGDMNSFISSESNLDTPLPAHLLRMPSRRRPLFGTFFPLT